jgi:glucokinase
MYLGIEIGGTKLQLGAGDGSGAVLDVLRRFEVDPSKGAQGILADIARTGRELIAARGVTRIGVGFGGPVDCEKQTVVRSFHIQGWDGFPLGSWLKEQFGLPAAIANDADAAGLAEARIGAGAGCRVVFYITVGTGVGGSLIVEGKVHGNGIASEIGHLRPGLSAADPEQTVESFASGWGIARFVRERLEACREAPDGACAELLELCGGDPFTLDTRRIAEAARGGNPVAIEGLRRCWRTLGWAVAQVITLTAPEIVVIGGGVSLIGEKLFFAPLREEVDRYVYPPLHNSYAIKPAALGEEVVVHGAIAVAREAR